MSSHKEYIFFNGEMKDSLDPAFPPNDLSVLRGYGVFDFFRVIKGVPLYFQEHWNRLAYSAQNMHLHMPFTQIEVLRMMEALYHKMPYEAAGVRIILTGGNSRNGYLPEGKPNSMVSLQPLQPLAPEMSDAPFSLMSFSYCRNFPTVKTIDYSMGIWLQPVLQKSGFHEALYVSNGLVSECPRNNIFLVTQQGTLVTPKMNILAGITRMRVLARARAFMNVEEREVRLEELYTAKEIFITSTSKGVQPVTKVDDYFIGNGSQTVSRELYRQIYMENESKAGF